MSLNLMLLPTLACQAGCRYCFTPYDEDNRMPPATIEAVIAWGQAALDPEQELHITYHGGEPLLAGYAFYQDALPRLQDGLAPRRVSFSLQSNLWALTDPLCELFKTYRVSLGTSLDGPEAVNDAQRGPGYFGRTWAGIQRARRHGLTPGVICTFTAQSAPQADAVFDFFRDQGLDFSIHAALPSLTHGNGGWALSPEDYAHLLAHLLPRYLAAADRLRINTLDDMCQAVASGRASLCTFNDCLGKYLAVDPEGWIFPCQRFAGIAPYRVGHVGDRPSMADLAQSPFWQTLAARQARVEDACGDCPYLAVCQGGCPYHVMAANGGRLDGDPREPLCPAYRQVFSMITDQALEAVFSPNNLDSVVEHGAERRGLLHTGRLSQIMRDCPHPKELARRARKMVAAAALGMADTPQGALHLLTKAGVVTQPERAQHSLDSLRQELDSQPGQGLANAYLHITDRCNLHCSHCYAEAGPEGGQSMPLEAILRLVRYCAEGGFSKCVITGGEPLTHPQADALLAGLAEQHESLGPMKIVLRSNLAVALDPHRLELIGNAVHQVVVSVDGGPDFHDARRGAGSYARTLANLEALIACEPRVKVRLTAALTSQQAGGEQGASVRRLADELGLEVRIKSVLPLGRGADLPLSPDFYSEICQPDDALLGVRPASTCGLGMNLNILPSGECTPCYALTAPRHALGNAMRDGLGEVLAANRRYQRVTVDSNRACRSCGLRYLCGGFCRAWGLSDDPNSPPEDCTALYARAEGQLAAALAVLGVTPRAWQEAQDALQHALMIG